MENYIHAILQNLADQKDMTGSGIYGTGRRRRRARRTRRGRGLVGGFDGSDDMEAILASMKDVNLGDEEGEGIYGTGRRRRRRRVNKFNIGKYSRAIANGKTKTEAKMLARK